MKAIVVGAGLAGLTAGCKLKQGGWDVTVLEAGSYAGGRVAAQHADGYTVDTGATQISSGYTEYIALCHEMGLEGELVPSSQVVGFARNGRVIEIDSRNALSGPLSPIVSLCSKVSVLKTLVDKACLNPPLNHLDISASHRDDDENFRDYGARRLTREAYDFLAAPVLRGNFVRNPDLATKLEWFSITDNFARRTMLGLKGGVTRLPIELASRLDVRLNAPVKRVEQRGERVAVSWQQDGQEFNETSDACVVATRLPEAIAISPAYAAIAGPLNQKLRYSRGLVAHLGFRKATRSKVIGVFTPVAESAHIALVWVDHNKEPGCAPPGHSLISCYFDDANADNCYDMADERVTSIARNYLEKLFPELQGQCDLELVTRWPIGIPFPEPGVYREVHKLKQQLSANDRIQYAGDYFTCTGQNSAIYYGRLVAENILATQ